MSIEGKTVCVIGEFDSQPRNEIEFGLYDIGAEVVKKIGKKVDLVIAGRDAGKRLEEAQALGRPIVGEYAIDPIFDDQPWDTILAMKR